MQRNQSATQSSVPEHSHAAPMALVIAHRHNKAVLVDSCGGSVTGPILNRHCRTQVRKFRISKEACDCGYSRPSQMSVGNGNEDSKKQGDTEAGKISLDLLSVATVALMENVRGTPGTGSGS
jgi:hypothetical protein